MSALKCTICKKFFIISDKNRVDHEGAKAHKACAEKILSAAPTTTTTTTAAPPAALAAAVAVVNVSSPATATVAPSAAADVTVVPTAAARGGEPIFAAVFQGLSLLNPATNVFEPKSTGALDGSIAGAGLAYSLLFADASKAVLCNVLLSPKFQFSFLAGRDSSAVAFTAPDGGRWSVLCESPSQATDLVRNIFLTCAHVDIHTAAAAAADASAPAAPLDLKATIVPADGDSAGAGPNSELTEDGDAVTLAFSLFLCTTGPADKPTEVLVRPPLVSNAAAAVADAASAKTTTVSARGQGLARLLAGGSRGARLLALVPLDEAIAAGDVDAALVGRSTTAEAVISRIANPHAIKYAIADMTLLRVSKRGAATRADADEPDAGVNEQGPASAPSTLSDRPSDLAIEAVAPSAGTPAAEVLPLAAGLHSAAVGGVVVAPEEVPVAATRLDGPISAGGDAALAAPLESTSVSAATAHGGHIDSKDAPSNASPHVLEVAAAVEGLHDEKSGVGSNVALPIVSPHLLEVAAAVEGLHEKSGVGASESSTGAVTSNNAAADSAGASSSSASSLEPVQNVDLVSAAAVHEIEPPAAAIPTAQPNVSVSSDDRKGCHTDVNVAAAATASAITAADCHVLTVLFGAGPLGLMLSSADGTLKQVSEDGQAAKLGLRVGDFVTSIAGVDVRALEHTERMAILKSQPRPVELVLERRPPAVDEAADALLDQLVERPALLVSVAADQTPPHEGDPPSTVPIDTPTAAPHEDGAAAAKSTPAAQAAEESSAVALPPVSDAEPVEAKEAHNEEPSAAKTEELTVTFGDGKLGLMLSASDCTIKQITAGGQADKAGLRVGDRPTFAGTTLLVHLDYAGIMGVLKAIERPFTLKLERREEPDDKPPAPLLESASSLVATAPTEKPQALVDAAVSDKGTAPPLAIAPSGSPQVPCEAPAGTTEPPSTAVASAPPAATVSSAERLTITFEAGKLGIGFIARNISKVVPGSQAETLGVKVGDNMVVIGGSATASLEHSAIQQLLIVRPVEVVLERMLSFPAPAPAPPAPAVVDSASSVSDAPFVPSAVEEVARDDVQPSVLLGASEAPTVALDQGALAEAPTVALVQGASEAPTVALDQGASEAPTVALDQGASEAPTVALDHVQQGADTPAEGGSSSCAQKSDAESRAEAEAEHRRVVDLMVAALASGGPTVGPAGIEVGSVAVGPLQHSIEEARLVVPDAPTERSRRLLALCELVLQIRAAATGDNWPSVELLISAAGADHLEGAFPDAPPLPSSDSDAPPEGLRAEFALFRAEARNRRIVGALAAAIGESALVGATGRLDVASVDVRKLEDALRLAIELRPETPEARCLVASALHLRSMRLALTDSQWCRLGELLAYAHTASEHLTAPFASAPAYARLRTPAGCTPASRFAPLPAAASGSKGAMGTWAAAAKLPASSDIAATGICGLVAAEVDALQLELSDAKAAEAQRAAPEADTAHPLPSTAVAATPSLPPAIVVKGQVEGAVSLPPPPAAAADNAAGVVGALAMPSIEWEQLTPSRSPFKQGGMGGIVFRATFKETKNSPPMDAAVKLVRVAARAALEAEASSLFSACGGRTNNRIIDFTGLARGRPTEPWRDALGDLIGSVLGRDGAMLALVSRWQVGGSLFELLHVDRAWWPASQLASRLGICADVAEGLAHLHAAPNGLLVIHGDIKSENVLLADRSAAPRAVLSDFGLSSVRLASFGSDRLSASIAAGSERRGSWPYMAPEMLEQDDDTESLAASRSTDVYALGTVVWEVLTGAEPWAHCTKRKREKIAAQRKRDNAAPESLLDCEPTLPRDTPATVVQALRSCFGERSKRPSALAVYSILAEAALVWASAPAVAPHVAQGLVGGNNISEPPSAAAPQFEKHVARVAGAGISEPLPEAAATPLQIDTQRVEEASKPAAAVAPPESAAPRADVPKEGPPPPPAPPEKPLDVSFVPIAAAPPPPPPAFLSLLSPSSFVASASTDYTIRLRYVNDLDSARSMRGHTGVVSGLCALPCGRVLASSSWDKSVRLWRISSGECIGVLEGHEAQVNHVCFYAPVNLLASASDDGTVKVWDITTGKCAKTLRGHAGGVNHVCALPSDGLIASASSDCTVRLWRVGPSSIACVQVLLHPHSVTCVCDLPGGGLLATAADQNVHLWEKSTGAPVKILKGHSTIVSSVCAVGAGILASASFDTTIRLWRVATGECVSMLVGHSHFVKSVAALPAADALASAALDGTCRLWRASTGECIHVARGHFGGLYSVEAFQMLS